MELKGSHIYDAPIEAVMVLLRDRDATVAKYESMKHRDVRILELVDEAERLRVRSSRVVEVVLPGFAQKFLKPTNTLVQTDEWSPATNGAWTGTFDVEMHGSPVRLHGSMRLVPEDGRCRHDVTIDVTVKVPIVGGKIADWAAKNDVRRSLDAEFAYNDGWLADHPVSR